MNFLEKFHFHPNSSNIFICFFGRIQLWMYTPTYFYEKHCLNFFHFAAVNWPTDLKSGTKKPTFVNKQTKSYMRAKSVSSVQLCLTLCDPMNCSNQSSLSITNSWSLLKLMSTESVLPSIRWSHPLSSPSPPAFNLSQHQGLFKLISYSHQVTKILEFQLQHQSFQWTFRTDFL